jgi:hypothetical protein
MKKYVQYCIEIAYSASKRLSGHLRSCSHWKTLRRQSLTFACADQGASVVIYVSVGGAEHASVLLTEICCLGES